jgi:hypothetical protein
MLGTDAWKTTRGTSMALDNGYMRSRALTLILLALFPFCASATTWGKPEAVADPIRNGAKCVVSEPMSSGSYIYHWPSKYDQVFWPLTDRNGIWFCRDTGFAAFIGDFELSAAERGALSAYLPQVYVKRIRGRPDLPILLELLQQSYSKREKDREFRIQLLRVLAYYNDTELHDYVASAAFRREALTMMEEDLGTSLREEQRLEYLFVSAAYYQELGETEKSDHMLRQLDAASAMSSEKLKGYVEYLSSLKGDVARIVPGGPLAPDLPDN